MTETVTILEENIEGITMSEQIDQFVDKLDDMMFDVESYLNDMEKDVLTSIMSNLIDDPETDCDVLSEDNVKRINYFVNPENKFSIIDSIHKVVKQNKIKYLNAAHVYRIDGFWYGVMSDEDNLKIYNELGI